MWAIAEMLGVIYGPDNEFNSISDHVFKENDNR